MISLSGIQERSFVLVIPVSSYLHFYQKQYFHICSQLQKQNMLFNTKSESQLFVDKVPCRTFFFCPPG